MKLKTRGASAPAAPATPKPPTAEEIRADLLAQVQEEYADLSAQAKEAWRHLGMVEGGVMATQHWEQAIRAGLRRPRTDD